MFRARAGTSKQTQRRSLSGLLAVSFFHFSVCSASFSDVFLRFLLDVSTNLYSDTLWIFRTFDIVVPLNVFLAAMQRDRAAQIRIEQQNSLVAMFNLQCTFDCSATTSSMVSKCPPPITFFSIEPKPTVHKQAIFTFNLLLSLGAFRSCERHHCPTWFF